jgi:bile acid:Na+ symporter, BASS family
MIDAVTIQFSEDNLMVLNIILAFIMFGIALDLKMSDFKLILQYPKATFVGISSQFFLLPAITFCLVWIIEPAPSVALGMLLVAACPGGNISNFMTHFARGNTALSVCLTAIGTAASILMTPFNLNFWASLYPPTSELLSEVSLNPFQVLETIFILAGIPLLIGMLVRHYWPSAANKLSSFAKPVSIFVFISFVIIAFMNNVDVFTNYIHLIVFIVLIHNALALLSGYFLARSFQLPQHDQRTIAIETGIQNSGLGLVLTFNFFNGMGGMALVAAWWGIWHIIAGLSISYYWSLQQAKHTA